MMSEPASASSAGILALAVAICGPLAGEYAVIVLASLAGSLWALSARSAPGAAASALMLLRLVLTAVVLTGSATWWIEQRYGLPAHRIMAPVAFGIGAIGDRWRDAIRALWANAAGRFSGSGGKG